MQSRSCVDDCLLQVFIYNLKSGKIEVVIATDSPYSIVKKIWDNIFMCADGYYDSDKSMIKDFVDAIKRVCKSVVILKVESIHQSVIL